jgi:hypothetical protein
MSKDGQRISRNNYPFVVITLDSKMKEFPNGDYSRGAITVKVQSHSAELVHGSASSVT